MKKSIIRQVFELYRNTLKSIIKFNVNADLMDKTDVHTNAHVGVDEVYPKSIFEPFI